MRVFAPAKINLALHVTGQRADGYHLLESLVAFANIGDVLTIEAASSDSLSFSGPFGSTLAADPATNLVLKAGDALRDAAGSRPCPPVALHLEKNLPLSSGIGGGSADAAATLKGLNDHWSLGLPIAQLCEIGLPLGADVPMCLHGRPLIARGIGEDIEPVDLPDFHLLLVNPGVAVSTPAIFKALVKKENGGLSLSPFLQRGEGGVRGAIDNDRSRFPPLIRRSAPPSPRWSNGEKEAGAFLTYLRTTRNDLQPPAISLQPVIGEVIAVLEKNGALFARMSGSGATCFGIFADEATAAQAAAEIRLQHPCWWVA